MPFGWYGKGFFGPGKSWVPSPFSKYPMLGI
jgi:hypothetical protein